MIAFWTARARLDLRDLTLFLGEYDSRVASRAALDLFRRANRLAIVPHMGRPGEEPSTRELSVPKWKRVIVYRVEPERVEVLALRDPRQQQSSE